MRPNQPVRALGQGAPNNNTLISDFEDLDVAAG
jgi:hypothetical protein